MMRSKFEGEVCISSLKAILRPSNTVGNLSTHNVLGWHIRAVLNVLYHRSTIPFDCGWYEVVLARLEPVKLINALKSADSNWVP
ncbi:hypothetical protein FF38_08475 [Lucilia cuprina]|uniref:Uncharacterized protein n=1 Tax=Lucilia cuprina TaxID=7375 RepID=A0A0L0C887_LUCCU|nr:hypothetical protein FF38_08475 [Lucilia cuprina]